MSNPTIFTSSDGVTWVSFSEGYPDFQAYALYGGVSNIRNTTQQAQTGVSEIQVTSPDETQLGASRIQITSFQVQDGTSNLRVTTSQTQLGHTAVVYLEGQNQYGMARIQVSGNLQTQIGHAFINYRTTQIQTGIARIQIAAEQEIQTGATRIQTTTTQIQIGISRIQVVNTQEQNGTTRLQITSLITQAGDGRVQKTGTQPQKGDSSVQGTNSQTVIGEVRITATSNQTQSGTSKIQITTNQVRTGVSKVSGVYQISTSSYTDTNNTSSWSVATIILHQFETLIVAIGDPSTSISGVKWNNKPLNQDVSVSNNTSAQSSIWSLPSSESGATLAGTSGHLVITFAANVDAKVAVVEIVRGLNPYVPLYEISSRTGNNDSPSAAPIDVTSTDKFIIALGVTQTSLSSFSAGTVDNPFQQGLIDGTDGSTKDIVASEAFVTSGDVGEITSGWIGQTAAPWAIAVAYYENYPVQTVLGTTRLQLTDLQTQLGMARTQVASPQNQIGKARFQTTVFVTESGQSAIQNTTNQHQIGESAFQNTTIQTQIGGADVRFYALQSQIGRSDVRNTTVVNWTDNNNWCQYNPITLYW